MKRICITILVIVGLSLTATKAFAQSALKIGHLNVNEVIESLPERDSAVVVLEKETNEYKAVFEEMQVVYNNLVEEYQKNVATYSDLMRKTKEDDLVEKQRRIADFEQMASSTLQQRNQELIQPIYDKVMKAIGTVANQHSYTYILDVSRGGVVFMAKDSNDVTQLVLAKLK
jgi:outer membrane protein